VSASPETVPLRREAARSLGPPPSLRELNLICWGLFTAFLALPLLAVCYSHYRSGQPLLKVGESDFVYLYGMGRVFNEHPAEELYDWATQKKVCTEVHPHKTGEYGPIPYHPIIGILFRPFAKLPYVPAFLLWISFAFVAYVVGVMAISRIHFRNDPLRRSLILCFALSFYPFCWTMMSGHLSTLGFLAIAIAILQDHRRRSFLSGLALSVCVYKPSLLVLILPMLAVTRRFKTCIGFAVGGVALGLIATAVQGTRLWPGYVGMLFSFGQGAAKVQTRTFKEVWKYVDVWSLFQCLPKETSWIAQLILLAFAMCLAGVLAWMWWKSAAAGEPVGLLVWATTLTCTLVLNVYVPIYDCVLVVIGAILTAGILKDTPRSRLHTFFAVGWLMLLGSSWITTDVAETYGVQIFTVILIAFGVVQFAGVRNLLMGRRPT
jgi:hypothetical protein